MSQRAFRLLLVAVCLTMGTAATAAAKDRHKHPSVPPVYAPQTEYVYVGGTVAGADPDPRIRAALIREFGRRR
jgi:hypothetical protein